jgi:hypothetical protein
MNPNSAASSRMKEDLPQIRRQSMDAWMFHAHAKHHRFALIFLIVLLGGFRSMAQSPVPTTSPASSAFPARPVRQTLSTSPDGKFMVCREQAEYGERGEARKRMEICSDSGKELYAWISGLGATTLLWSPDSRYLAVNDMPGEDGDLVRLFHLDPDAGSVTPLREPDGKKLLEEEESRHGSFFSTVERVHLRALEWREGRLWCLFTGSVHLKREPMIHASFHYLWVFAVHGVEAPKRLEEWKRTEPEEVPARDPQ